MRCAVSILVAFFVLRLDLSAAETFTVATYNLENYLAGPNPSRESKRPESKAQVVQMILSLRPDVLAVQEIGQTNALIELRASLKKAGLDYPFWEHVSGFDTNIFVAVLSRFPIVARRSHSRDGFLLNGRRFRISRGIVEVDIRVNPNYTFTLFTTHLKSQRPVGYADQAELRLEEAAILREKIDDRLRSDPNANIIVLGDFNDVQDSPSTRRILGRGTRALVDTRPAERNGRPLSKSAAKSDANRRTITWTYFYAKEDTYSRIDYIFLSRGMAREWIPEESYVMASPDWGLASDHRPVLACFVAKDR